jgi:hypothetical protein
MGGGIDVIEVKVGKDIGVKLMATGSAKDLTNDVLCIVNAVYNSINQRNEMDAKIFRLLVGIEFCNEEFWNRKPDGTAISIAVPKKEDPEVE